MKSREACSAGARMSLRVFSVYVEDAIPRASLYLLLLGNPTPPIPSIYIYTTTRSLRSQAFFNEDSDVLSPEVPRPLQIVRFLYNHACIPGR